MSNNIKLGNDNDDDYEEIYNRMLNSIKLQNEALKYININSNIFDKFTNYSSYLFLGFFIIISLLFISIGVNDNVEYVKKQEIQTEIQNSIIYGADLRAIRNIYENRRSQSKEFLALFNKADNYYNYDVPLTKILEDIRTSLFTKETDLNTIKRIDNIIKEQIERNPFETLESNQKDIFENLRIRSGNNYPIIQIEVDKLASEIESKNALVNKYLNLSNTSFWISIFALIVSVAIGIFQIYQNRSSRIQNFLSTALAAWNEGIESRKSDKKENS